MSITVEKATKAKPFLKWAGGKTQLLDEIDKRLPKDEIRAGQIDTYVEPFVGGGAVFFHIAHEYPEIKRYFLFDINQDLVNCFNEVKTNVDVLIDELRSLQAAFLRKRSGRKAFYYEIRDQFNTDRTPAKLIFLNKTCYNGLYRVNRRDEFNVPFGDYKNPTICNENNLRSASQILQKAEIICGDFTDSQTHIDSHTFVYLDPPYRPISPTASFTSYSKDSFSEDDQERLARFFAEMATTEAKLLLSNSATPFVLRLYEDFSVNTVYVSRCINCISMKRGKIPEVLVRNYESS